MRNAQQMLMDIGIDIEPEINLSQDLSLHDLDEYEETRDDRLRKAGCDPDRTSVDTFMSRPDFGFAYCDEE